MSKIDYTLDLTRMHLELKDKEFASKNLVSCLFSICILSNRTPRAMMEDIMKNMVTDEVWEEEIKPGILEDMR